jgi:hypothetical protein
MPFFSSRPRCAILMGIILDYMKKLPHFEPY